MYKEIESCIVGDYEIDMDLLPKIFKDILKNYLIPLNPVVPIESLLLSVYVLFSNLLCFNRVKIVSECGMSIYPNLYGMTFMPSGSGKDKPIGDIKKLLKGVFVIIDERMKNDFIKREDKIEQEAALLEKKERNKHIKENRPRKMVYELGNATLEGLMSQRKVLMDCNFGSILLKISEFVDFITSGNQQRIEFLSAINESYDGDSPSKVIKTEKEFFDIKDVPQTMIGHSSLSGIIEDGRANKFLKNFFDRGNARRCLVCYPKIESTKNKLKENPYSEEKTKHANSKLVKISENIEMIFVEYLTHGDDHQYFKTIKITKEAIEVYNKYTYITQKNAFDIDIEKYEGLHAEVFGRAWKTLKLAGVLAAFDNPENKEITKDHMLSAIYQVSVFGNHMQRFYEIDQNNDVEKLFEYILNNPKTMKSDIRGLSFVEKDKTNGKQTRWINDTLEQVIELCDKKGFIFKEEKGWKGSSNRARRYSIIKPPEHKQPTQNIKVNYSIGDSMNVNVVNFEPRECDFFEFGNIVNGKLAYSATAFNNNYRNQENVIGSENMIMFDIDNDDTTENNQLTIEKFLPKLKGRFIGLISPTKSHKKEKGKKPTRERFRIILPTSTPLPKNKEKRFEAMKAVAQHFGIMKFVGEKEMLDNARYYFPAGKECIYIKEGSILNWEVFEIEKTMKKDYKINNNYVNKGKSKNAVGDIKITDDKGNIRNFSDYEYLAIGEKARVHCPYHDDKSSSGFITRSKESGNLYLNCSACNESWWIK